MSGLDIFAWVILFVLLALVLVVFVILAMLPGKIAKSRGHPQAEAINVAGWLGMFLGIIGWAVALVWAYTRSPFLPQESVGGQGDDVQ